MVKLHGQITQVQNSSNKITWGAQKWLKLTCGLIMEVITGAGFMLRFCNWKLQGYGAFAGEVNYIAYCIYTLILTKLSTTLVLSCQYIGIFKSVIFMFVLHTCGVENISWVGCEGNEE